jgi:RimJ/RimL family protein N-acetyltransferase
MEVVRYGDPRAFRRDAELLLMADASRNNLPIAILQTLTDQPAVYPVFHLWLAMRDGTPIGLALQTEPHHVVLADPLDAGAIRTLAEAVVADGAPLPGVTANLPWTDRFASEVAMLTGHRVERVLNEGVWELTEVAHVPAPSGRMRTATPQDRDLILGWLWDFNDEVFPPGHPRDEARMRMQVDMRLAGEGGGYRLWEDGEAVTMSGHHDVPGLGSRIGPVYTPPPHRRRGYATRLVAELSSSLLERGDPACFLFTDMANPTSNAIYARIGYVKLGEAAENAFRPSD